MRHASILTILFLAAVDLPALDLLSLPVPPPAEATVDWHAGQPADEALGVLWEQTGGEIGAQVRLGQSTAGLEVLVRVHDAVQSNVHSGKFIWRGDAIYLHLDGRGDGWPQKQGRGADDLTIIAGLGSAGPVALVSEHGDSAQDGERPLLLRGIVRDEAAATTTYRLVVPWALAGTAPGLSDRLGVAVNVAHKDAQGKDTWWGSRSALRQLALAAPAEAGPVAAPGLGRVLTTVQAQVAMPPGQRGVLEAVLGSTRREVVLSGSDWQRFAVRVQPEEVVTGAERLELRVRDGAAVRWETSQAYTSLVLMEHQVAARVARLRAAERDSRGIVAAHLDGLAAILAQTAAQRPFMGDHSQWPALYVDTLDLLLQRLPTEAVDLAWHARTGVPLVGAFVSRADDTLQFYGLQLPYAWDPQTAYPLTVYLHGSGSPYVMGGLAVIFDNRHQDTLFRYDEIDPAAVPPLHRGFVLAPWARGNMRYVGPAGQDVFQAMAAVEGRFRIDPDRRYLTGFSMGSGGAGRLAMYRPDLWAGVNFAAGFGPGFGSSRHDLRDNLRGIPMQLWCGMDDTRFYPPAQTLFAELQEAGFQVAARFVPDVTHTYPYPEYNRMVGALMEHRRETYPRRFAFRTDDASFPGRNGVEMRLPSYGDGTSAGFTCVIDGSVVSIDSEGCDGLRIDCARLGLDGQAEVTIRWNGKEAYRGKPAVVTVPERFELRRTGWFELR